MNRVRELTKQIDRKIERYENLAKMLGGKGMDYSGERVQKSMPEGSSMETALVMKKSLEEELEKDIAKLKDWQDKMSKLIITNVDDRVTCGMALAYFVDSQSYMWIAKFYEMTGNSKEEARKGKEGVRRRIKVSKNTCKNHLSEIKW